MRPNLENQVMEGKQEQREQMLGWYIQLGSYQGKEGGAVGITILMIQARLPQGNDKVVLTLFLLRASKWLKEVHMDSVHCSTQCALGNAFSSSATAESTLDFMWLAGVAYIV
jgi:hypothetical protein